MKKVFYNIVCSSANMYDQTLYNLNSTIRMTPKEVIEYVKKDYDAKVEQYIDDEDQREYYEFEMTEEKLEKLAVGKSIDEDFVPEVEECGTMFSWTVYKMEVEVNFPLDGHDKLEDGIEIKFIDKKEKN